MQVSVKEGSIRFPKAGDAHNSEQHVSYLDPSTRGRGMNLFFMRTFQKFCFHSAMKVYMILSLDLCSAVLCDSTLVLITPLQQVFSFDLRDIKYPTACSALCVSSTRRAAVFHIAKYCSFVSLFYATVIISFSLTSMQNPATLVPVIFYFITVAL